MGGARWLRTSPPRACHRGQLPPRSHRRRGGVSRAARTLPGGCCVLEQDRETVGYIICHPGTFGHPAPLDTLLGELPHNADVLYIHDISIDLGMRGQRLACEAVDHANLLTRNYGFDRVALVAANDLSRFGKGMVSWARIL